jgi:hypothetical protein
MAFINEKAGENVACEGTGKAKGLVKNFLTI